MITRVGGRGDGLAEWQGSRLYVPQTLVGDRLMVKFGAHRGDGWEGVPVSLLEEGKGRAEPPCPHFGSCGGCVAQHMDDATYDAWKLESLTTVLSRCGLLGEDVTLHPVSRTPAGSRRRAVMNAVRRGKRVWLGFNEAHSHRLVDLSACTVLAPPLVALIAPLRDALAPLLADGQSVDVAMTLLDDGVDLVLEGLNRPDLRALEHLADFAAAQDLARLSWRPHDGQPAEPIAMRRTGLLGFGQVSVSPAPGAFLQASREGESALVTATLAGVGEADTIADLFAGSGTFSFPLAVKAKVHAVEGDPTAFASLMGGARQMAGKVTAEKRDLFRDPLPPYDLNRFQAVVFDPPRAGAQAQAAQIADSTVPNVVGVSCNPISFARDAELLIKGGYRLTDVWPVDQFLWSSHMELVGWFKR
ncbi:class I SAM-dependent RNA methyltransferase [Niveispirillum sp. KHB5.9]|uniref:class I SAM-dependent RNA methyltransferase n=1 Tax=Niveispirillum sp. KHB5.9 TaxID=3400269 RepID=UPI003A88ED77